jgi:hypothetical protein
MKRLVWLVGPPGAGKTTFGRTQRAVGVRVVELTDMLAPLVEPAGIDKGVLTANGALVRMIRALELHPDNRGLPPLMVIVGLAPEDELFAGDPADEAVWLLLPPRERWREQLTRRPTTGPGRIQYADYAYAEQWYGRFEAWIAASRAIEPIACDYRPELVGALPEDERTSR